MQDKDLPLIYAVQALMGLIRYASMVTPEDRLPEDGSLSGFDAGATSLLRTFRISMRVNDDATDWTVMWGTEDAGVAEDKVGAYLIAFSLITGILEEGE